MSIFTKQEITTEIDEEGNEKTTIKETSAKIERSSEPDYIKIYTDMWCEFNQIPQRWRELFLQLAIRMSYANSNDLENSQTVVVYGMISKSITEACGWKDKSNLRRGLKALCDCGAIKNVGRATYQINPSYASKGSWKYNPKLANGGVEDLIAVFKFKDKSIKTDIIWADDGQDNKFNDMYREGLSVERNDETILKAMEIKNNEQRETSTDTTESLNLPF